MSARFSYSFLALTAAALLTTAAQASAQSLRLTVPADTPSMLVSGMVQQGSQPAPRSTAKSGFGIGVKGGVLFSSFNQAASSYKSSSGWQGSLFLGGLEFGIGRRVRMLAHIARRGRELVEGNS